MQTSGLTVVEDCLEFVYYDPSRSTKHHGGDAQT